MSDIGSPFARARGFGGRRHVFLRDMVLPASVGVHAFEKDAAQRIRINVDLGVDDDPLAAPGADQLSRVVDYEEVARAVRGIIASGHVNLVETLAERIAANCLQDARVAVVRVRIEKLDIFPDTQAVGVEIERVRSTISGAC